MDAISDVVRRRTDADLIVDAGTGERWTYARASDQALRLAGALRDAGVRRGDRVTIVMENSPAVLLAYLAALYLGATIVLVNRASAADEIAYAIDALGGSLTLVSPNTAPLVDAPRSVLVTSGADLRLDGRSVLDRAPIGAFEGVSGDDPFSITLTSGSTARPKGVVHTIATLFGNALSFNAYVGATEGTIFLHGLPMSYMAGLLNSIVCPFMAGGTIVIGEEFSARTFLDFWAIPRRYGVNTMWATPTAIALLLELDRSAQGVEHCRATSMRIFVGTAPLPPDLRERFETRYGVPLRTSYGLSELLLLTVRRPERGEDPDSNGAPLPDVEIAIERADASSDGEVVVRTPYASPGYVGAAGPAPDRFATGDLGRIGGHGELRITGRTKDLIITGGVNVSPAAVETAMRAHPAVREAVAVGVPDRVLGEAVAVAVEIAPAADPSEVRRALAGEYAARLGQAQRPRHVIVVGDFPRSATGKIRRADVRALVTSALAER